MSKSNHDLVLLANNRRLGDVRIIHQCTLDLYRTDPGAKKVSDTFSPPSPSLNCSEEFKVSLPAHPCGAEIVSDDEDRNWSYMGITIGLGMPGFV